MAIAQILISQNAPYSVPFMEKTESSHVFGALNVRIYDSLEL